ncbi:major royal jelly protein-domain-containing protein [Rhodofomes roseus]|uniref:Major royal jelly protein-domain-containing protein n=1 Tax=Rhodofomes roseus TaxID=34475 RepID=A0ABQ8K733_9APHY|nr:major royal jelly protein-domain-containing protein [Rhodofomes roseus]KAH9832498.1 major royal jelly protein-domain-containing protein [Rhodofomes roseus]
MALLLPFILWAVAAAAQGVFDFPEYPPAGTPDPNSTLANGAAPYPYNVYEDPGLAQARIHYDTGSYGPTLELVHAYYNYWPTGVGVASDGSIFTTFSRGNESYTLATFTSTTTEEAWPNQEWNTPAAFANESNPGYSIATDKLLLVQAVVVDGLDRVWALDTGRPEVNGSYLLAQVPGGPKIVGFYLNGTNFATYTFPANVVYADSSINDIRLDLRGEGYAYIPDSSPNRPGIIVLNLATGESWRHLDGHPSVTPDNGFVPVYDGVPFYLYPVTSPYAVNNFGLYAADGIALSPDGEYIYFAPLASRQFWRIPTSYLKVKPGPDYPSAYMLAKRAVEHLGESGSNADGMETDSSGYIYAGAPEHNAVTRYNPATGLVEPFVRDPAIQWPDTLAVATLQSGGSYVYFTCNQLWLGPNYQNGTDLRTKPWAMFRAPIEAQKATQLD